MTHAFRFRLPAAAMCAALAISLGACAKETHVVRKAHMDAKAANMRGNELYRRGDLASAAREYDRAKLIALGVDDREMVAEAHNNLGLLLMAAGDYAGAVAKFDEALSINEAIGNMRKAAANLMNRGEASLSRGSLDDARDDAERAQKLSRESRDRYGEAAAANVLGLIALSEGDVPLARERFRRALDAARELKRHRLAAACLSNLGRISEQEGDLEGALSSYIMAHSEDRLVEHAPGIGEDLFRIGRVLFRMDKTAEARGYLERALAVHTQLGQAPGMIGDLELLTGIAEREGDTSRAAVLRKRLSDIREGMAGGPAGSKKKGAR